MISFIRGFQRSHVLLKITFMLTISSVAFNITGFSTDHWITNNITAHGLWRQCNLRDNYCSSGPGEGWQAVGGLLTLGLLLLLISVALMIVRFLKEHLGQRVQYRAIILLLLYFSGVFITTGCALASLRFWVGSFSPSWSWALSVCGGLLTYLETALWELGSAAERCLPKDTKSSPYDSESFDGTSRDIFID